mgnify:CR=1 FL=1
MEDKIEHKDVEVENVEEQLKEPKNFLMAPPPVEKSEMQTQTDFGS